ncbi:uncharacterized protein [Ptychodera flava]|uniref:uncharacterized protein n=1 Tax=Ptychodera flava TaxID=63121 RepID=UPI00396A1C86
MVCKLTLLVLLKSVFSNVMGEMCVDGETSRRLDSCLNTSPYGPKCNAVPNWSTLPNDNSYRWTCNCDPKCTYFGDCCFDYSEVCQNGTEPHPPANGSYSGENDFTSAHVCTRVTYSLAEGVWMNRNCPESWQDDVIREKCENIIPLDMSLRSIPVTWPAGRDVFANIYCALCNGIGHTELTMWKVSAQVGLMPDEVVEYLDSNNAVTASLDLVRAKRDMVKFVMEETVEAFARPCVYGIIDSCQSAFFDNQSEYHRMQQMCRSYFSIVETKSSVGRTWAFRNVHCAHCYNVLNERLKCGINMPLLKSRNVFIFPHTRTLSLHFHTNPRGYVSLSFHIRNGHFVHNKRHILYDFLCKVDEVFDPESQSCLNLLNLDADNNANQNTVDLTDATTLRNGLSDAMNAFRDKCPVSAKLFVFNKSDFMETDRTLIFKVNGDMLKSHIFEIVANGSMALVCFLSRVPLKDNVMWGIITCSSLSTLCLMFFVIINCRGRSRQTFAGKLMINMAFRCYLHRWYFCRV